MAFKHTSWGRTRGPKNLAGAPGTEIVVLANTNSLKGVTATAAGYPTENQRYLHVLVEDATEDGTNPGAVTVFGYNHAFLRWFEIPAEHALDNNGGASANDAQTGAAVDVPAAGSNAAPAAQVPGDREYRAYEIAGIDRVAFVHGTPAQVNVFAACSTF